ncbi:MAG: protein kinase [Deltaproteobacteria bacterium]|nr:protein kinase [Deltaproteobacteria bacterium]
MNSSNANLITIGTILGGKWIILEFIARGGMGEVYRAHQVNLNRDVAIKIISRQWIESIEADDEVETTLQRFQREVQAMAGINHPNVLQIFDYDLETINGKKGGKPLHYIAMEFIPGDTLRETMSEEGFFPEEGLTREWVEKYFLPTLNGVEAIHKKDIVHRDLKPENILLDGSIPKIADFGLSRSCRWKGVTQSVDIKGTLMYMSPEQLADFRRTDHWADIYSLGKILYEAVTGKISTVSDPSFFKCVGLEKPETVFFNEIDQIIRRATAENKNNRFKSIEEFRSAILKTLAISEQRPDGKSMWTFHEHPKWIWTGIFIALLSVLMMTVWHLLGNPGKSPGLPAQKVSLTADKPITATAPAFVNLKKPVYTKDNSTFHYVPAGTLLLHKGRRIDVKAFYMDETPVTNLQYVSFLNKIKNRLVVKNNAVIGDKKIWLMLGEVSPGYEPIIYKNDEFTVKHPGHTACPVLRVTAFGALAYARFYGERLPTEIEWIYAYQGARASLNPAPRGSCEQKPLPTPVILLTPNRLGIRGLNQCINEWTASSSMKTNKSMVYSIAGNSWQKEKNPAGYSIINRQPWESFEEVGFRCVIDAAAINN